MMGNKDITTLISSLAEQSVEVKDRRLLALALGRERSQNDLDSFMKDWNIETAPIRSVIIVANLMKARPDLSFPEKLLPRLDGVLSFCRFKNIQWEARFKKAADGLTESKIPFVLTGDGAMRALRQDYIGWIGKMDILVPASKYDQAAEILSSDGGGNSIIANKAWDDGVFQRASKYVSLSTEVFLPCPEDMAFMDLVRLYKNLVGNASAEKCLDLFIDLDFLAGLNGGLDSAVIWEDARLSGCEFQVLLASSVVGTVIPGILPDKWPESYEISGKKLKKYVIDFLFKRDVLNGAGKHPVLDAGSRKGLVPSAMKYCIWRLWRVKH